MSPVLNMSSSESYQVGRNKRNSPSEVVSSCWTMWSVLLTRKNRIRRCWSNQRTRMKLSFLSRKIEKKRREEGRRRRRSWIEKTVWLDFVLNKSNWPLVVSTRNKRHPISNNKTSPLGVDHRLRVFHRKTAFLRVYDARDMWASDMRLLKILSYVCHNLLIYIANSYYSMIKLLLDLDLNKNSAVYPTFSYGCASRHQICLVLWKEHCKFIKSTGK